MHTYIIPIYNLKEEQKNIYISKLVAHWSGWVKINGNIYFFLYVKCAAEFSSKELLFTNSTNDRDETERNEHLNI